MSSGGMARVNSQDHPLYWTDDIPVCHLSAVGICNNQIYRENAPTRREEHECEDSSFRFRPETELDVNLYGVFDGHDGSKLSNFAAQRFPAEILLGQLGDKLDDDEEILNVLHQAFVSVEKAYLDSISDQLALRCNLAENLPGLGVEVEGFTQVETEHLYNKTLDRLQMIEREISGGTSAAIALVIKQKLYVASLGCCRVLLCKTDPGGVLRVLQLSVEHDLNNPEELSRLSELGLDVEKIRLTGVIGNQPLTRTLGDCKVKVTYKEHELLSAATSDPVIAEPELTNPIELDECCCFLVLMSSGVYKSLEEAGEQNVNVAIASAVASEFAVQATLSGVAQGVVDKIGRIHHDTLMNADNRRKEMCAKREDMTLLVRNFNYPMPGAMGSPTMTNSGIKPVSVPYNLGQPAIMPLSVVIPAGSELDEEDDLRPVFTMGTMPSMHHSGLINSYCSMQRSSYTSSNDSTQSGEDSGRLFSKKSALKSHFPLDEDGRIKPYIDFSGLNDELNKLSEDQRRSLFEELEPKPAYETIPEEKETVSPCSPSAHPITEEATTPSTPSSQPITEEMITPSTPSSQPITEEAITPSSPPAQLDSDAIEISTFM